MHLRLRGPAAVLPARGGPVAPVEAPAQLHLLDHALRGEERQELREPLRGGARCGAGLHGLAGGSLSAVRGMMGFNHFSALQGDPHELTRYFGMLTPPKSGFFRRHNVRILLQPFD